MASDEQFFKVVGNLEAFNATSELLKLVVRRPASASRKRLYVFHSWRAAISGYNLPLDELEQSYFRNGGRADLHLVSDDPQARWVERHLKVPAIVLPYTVFQDPDIYALGNSEREFDFAFSSMFTSEHHARKHADLVFEVLRKRPSLRCVWIGGYSPFERWQMEHAYNEHFRRFAPMPVEWGEPWAERESFKCWYDGGGVFSNEVQKHVFLSELCERAAGLGVDIQFYINLTRTQVADVYRRSKASLSLASLDQWPRAITEALACGTPVIAMNDLVAGAQAVGAKTGRIVERNVNSIVAALEQVAELDPRSVHRSYFDEWGLPNASRRLVAAVEQHYGIEWGDIVGVQRPAETQFKERVRSAQ